MKLLLQFGLLEPKRIINWWNQVEDFPTLVLYKGNKWEFVMYDEDDTGQADYVCMFSEVKSHDPNWWASYEDISKYLDQGPGGRCECGAAYTSFPQCHMYFCPKWTRHRI